MSVPACLPSGRKALPSLSNSASKRPGPQLARTFLTVSASTSRRSVNGLRFGASEMIAPTFRSRLAQPSRRRPMPGANESSTVEWQNAHWMPIDLTLPFGFVKAVTPTTALSLRSAIVVAGSSRSTLPDLIWLFSALGSTSASTFKPTESAVLGETPGPTPPFLSPAIALCSCSASPQNALLPNVSWRKVLRPSSIIVCAWRAIVASWPFSWVFCVGGAAAANKVPHSPAPQAPAIRMLLDLMRASLCRREQAARLRRLNQRLVIGLWMQQSRKRSRSNRQAEPAQHGACHSCAASSCERKCIG